MRRAVLLDLDETLIEEERAAAAAFEATAAFACGQIGEGLDASSFVAAARAKARELWRASNGSDYCTAIGISSTEGLWCRFEGDDAPTRALRTWAPSYRRTVWSSALQAHGMTDDGLVETLAERFATERRARHPVFPDVVSALAELQEDYALGLVTNGASCLQREKLEASGLRRFFDVVVVSAEVGVGKPEAAIFRHALARLDAPPEDAAMVGDSLARDIDGAVAAGLSAIWINRVRQQRPERWVGLLEITSLSQAPRVLARRNAATVRAPPT